MTKSRPLPSWMKGMTASRIPVTIQRGSLYLDGARTSQSIPPSNMKKARYLSRGRDWNPRDWAAVLAVKKKEERRKMMIDERMMAGLRCVKGDLKSVCLMSLMRM